VIGGLLASPMNYHLGRKWPLIAAYIISVGGGLLQVFAPNLGAFVGGRSINGIALGIANATAPLYISEVRIVPLVFLICDQLILAIRSFLPLYAEDVLLQ
jgi:predicted MFS family arabinose efflux permease